MLHSRQQLVSRRGTAAPEVRDRFLNKQESSSSTDVSETQGVRESRPFSPETVPKSEKSDSHTHSHSTNSKSKGAARALSTEFQSLKLESMSTDDYGAATKPIVSALEKDILYSKQYLNSASGSLMDDNDSDSLSSSSGEERDLTQSMFKEQVTFFCQMKDFLLSQQRSLRMQLEALNSKLTTKKRRAHHTRRHRLAAPSSSNLHIPQPDKTDVPDQNGHNENIQQFFSCSSTDKSDYFQMCPICGLELENQENPEAFENHVAGHWLSAESI